MKLSDYIFTVLKEKGVGHVFLLPGGGCMHLVDSLGRSGIPYTCFLHEQAAVIAADAYAQSTGQLGVVLVTSGPGSTNAITGVAGAWIDSTPLLILSGQVQTKHLIGDSGLRQKGVQELDIISMVKGITNYSSLVKDPRNIKCELDNAFFKATYDRRGPVWLDIPLDIQAAEIDIDNLLQMHVEVDPEREWDYAGIYTLIKNAKKPIILAGNGIRQSNALDDFLKLVQHLQMPVLTTWRAADFFDENDSLYFGRPGSIVQRAANIIQQKADLVLIIGCRLDLPQVGFNYENFAKNALKFVVDVDYAELHKYPATSFFGGDNNYCFVKCDAKTFINGLLDVVKKADLSIDRYLDWLKDCYTIKLKHKVDDEKHNVNKDFVSTYKLINELSKQATKDDIIVPGSSGSCAEITLQTWKVKKGQRLFNNPGLGSMGYGLPAAIGAAIANPGKRIISIIGDGGLQHNIQELETLQRLNLPVKIFVLNNNGYASIRNTQKKFFNKKVCCDPDSGLTFPDLMKIAEAYKIDYRFIYYEMYLQDLVKTILEGNYSTICEVHVDPDLETTPRIINKLNEDGTIESLPMDQLYTPLN
jgi:acetolactate synthase-1/2/3 large subunit